MGLLTPSMLALAFTYTPVRFILDTRVLHCVPFL